MTRNARSIARVLAIGVIVVGAIVLLPPVLRGAETILRAAREQWWLVVLVALAIWSLIALRR